MIKKFINYAERGLLPDKLIKLGIKKLCKDRLNWAQQIGSENLEQFHQDFVEELKISPIALIPKIVNEQHYEVPASFFEIVLGQNLKYSSALWKKGVETLDDAEQKMLDLTFDRAQIENGMNVLELGCGWGSLTCYMAKKLPDSKIVAVSNSRDQRLFIENKCKQEQISNIKVITADMNDFTIADKFDRVISIEMFEHMRNYHKLLEKINSFLQPSGKLFVHIFTHKEMVYPFEDSGDGDWMAREFFSGGIMPSHRLLLYFQEHLKIEKTWRVSGLHYSKTSKAWLENMDKNKFKLMPIISKNYGIKNTNIWFQRWRIFFMACEELFGLYNGTEWGVSHYLFKKELVS